MTKAEEIIQARFKLDREVTQKVERVLLDMKATQEERCMLDQYWAEHDVVRNDAGGEKHYAWNRDNRPVVFRNRLMVERAMRLSPERKWQPKPLLLEDEISMTVDENFPGFYEDSTKWEAAPIILTVLIMLFRCVRPNSDMPCSGQVAGACQALDKKGWVFRKKPEAREGVKCFWDKESQQYLREITGYDKTKVRDESSWNKLPDELIAFIKRAFAGEDFYFSSDPCKEIDHRMPEIIRRALGLKVVPLTVASLIDFSWWLHYQVIAKKANNIKRNRCNACRESKGKSDIQRPAFVLLFGSAYLTCRKEGCPCKGCYWYDPLNPVRFLDATHQRAVEDATARINAILREISIEALKYQKKEDAYRDEVRNQNKTNSQNQETGPHGSDREQGEAEQEHTPFSLE